MFILMLFSDSKYENNYNFHDVTEENRREHNPEWSNISDDSYRVIMIDGSGSGKLNLFLNLISHQSNLDKIYLNVKDPCEAKYQFFNLKDMKVLA